MTGVKSLRGGEGRGTGDGCLLKEKRGRIKMIYWVWVSQLTTNH